MASLASLSPSATETSTATATATATSLPLRSSNESSNSSPGPSSTKRTRTRLRLPGLLSGLSLSLSLSLTLSMSLSLATAASAMPSSLSNAKTNTNTNANANNDHRDQRGIAVADASAFRAFRGRDDVEVSIQRDGHLGDGENGIGRNALADAEVDVDADALPSRRFRRPRGGRTEETRRRREPRTSSSSFEEATMSGRRSLQRTLTREDGDGDAPLPSYWWHENTPDERDVVYVFHDIESFSSSGGGDGDGEADAEEGRPENAIGVGQTAYSVLDHGKTNDRIEDDGTSISAMSSSGNNNNNNNNNNNDNNVSDVPMTVYSINVDNDPDVSDLPHKQPSRTPTLPPTRVPTAAPTLPPTHPPTEPGFFFPLWTDVFKGCTEGASPPEEYTLTSEMTESYLFGNKRDCCATWFGAEAEVLQPCLDDGLFHGVMSNGLMETQSDNGGGTSHTDWSYDEPPQSQSSSPTTTPLPFPSPSSPPPSTEAPASNTTTTTTTPTPPPAVPIDWNSTTTTTTTPPTVSFSVATDVPTADMANNDAVESTPWPTWSETAFPTPFVAFEVTSRPTLPPGSDGEDDVQGDVEVIAVPQDVSTPVPNPPPAFEQFLRPSNSPIAGMSASLLIMDPRDDDGSDNGSESNHTDDTNTDNADDNGNAVVIIAPASEAEPITFSTTTILYSESFESGLIDVDSTHSSCY
ncbi:hypothetical protein ACHAXS_002360, partial [Conticribra weissflogii]